MLFLSQLYTNMIQYTCTHLFICLHIQLKEKGKYIDTRHKKIVF